MQEMKDALAKKKVTVKSQTNVIHNLAMKIRVKD
jgi:hypothetical protein